MTSRKLAPLQNLTDRVAEALHDDITGGRYKIGDVLPSESEMSKTFGVSRTVMREAVSRLKADGLVASKQGAGIFVTAVHRPVSFSIDSTLEANIEELVSIVELRQGFEVEAAGLAALRATDDDLRVMRDALIAMHDAIERDDLKAGVEADIDFHAAIYVATHNPYYPQMFETFKTFLRENIAVSRENSQRRTAGVARFSPAQAEHEAVFVAIERRDDHQARLQARAHLENTRRRLLDRGTR